MTVPRSNRKLDWALWYVRLGFAPIPLCWPTRDGQCGCGRGHQGRDIGKAPLLGSGYHRVCPTEALVKRWWRRWPEANIGLLLEPSQLAVVDLDGNEAVHEGAGYGLPPGPVVTSRPGHEHRWYRRPQTCPATRRTHQGQTEAIDVLAKGYVVAPPSCHRTGTVYTFAVAPQDTPLEELPAWAVEMLQGGEDESGFRPAELPDDVTVLDADQAPGLSKTSRRLLFVNQRADGTPYPSRSEWVFAAITSLIRDGLDDATIAGLLLNPSHPVSERALERRRPAEYVAQEIGRARAKSALRRRGWKSSNSLKPAASRPSAAFQARRGVSSDAKPEETLADSDPKTTPQDRPGGPPGAEHLTDLGNARRLVRLRGENLHYVWRWSKWLVWEGTRWAEDDTGRVFHEATAIIEDLLEQAARLKQQAATSLILERIRKLENMAEKTSQWARKSESRARLEAAVVLARSEPGIPIRPADLDADPWLLNCSNGTLDLRTGTLRPHRREDLLTKSTGVPYDQKAKAPLWAAFLDRIMAGNQALIGFLQRAVGMSLVGTVRDHVLLILYGTGANGKSTFLETLVAALGDYAMTAAPDLLMARQGERHPTELADLFGKRLVVAVEVDEGRRLNEALVKRLTGGDTIKARRMREDFWEFRPSHTLWLAVNHRPMVRGTDHAIWRRLKLIPFTVTIPPTEQDPDLPAKLRGELPGILAWAVQGCLEWQQHGLGEPEEVRAATVAYRKDQDVLGQFLADCCVFSPSARAFAGDLYKAYVRWCGENGERSLSQKEFGTRLGERGFERSRSTGGRTVWHGLGLAVNSATSEGSEGSDPNFRLTPGLEEGVFGDQPENTVTPFTPLTPPSSGGPGAPWLPSGEAPTGPSEKSRFDSRRFRVGGLR